MTDRENRAISRRKNWSGEVVTNNTKKGDLYGDLSREDRLKAVSQLNEQVWSTAGFAKLPVLPRGEWPGEVFEVQRGKTAPACLRP